MDHVAKPRMSLGEEAGLRGWAEDMRAAAQHRSVYPQPSLYCTVLYCTVLVTYPQCTVNADLFLSIHVVMIFLAFCHYCQYYYCPFIPRNTDIDIN